MKKVLKVYCFILVMLMIGAAVLPVSAAYICTPTSIYAIFDEGASTVTINGTYKGTIQPTRAYTVTLTDADGKFIAMHSPLGSELDDGNGKFSYSFNLTSDGIKRNTLPLQVELSCKTPNVIEPIKTTVIMVSELEKGDANCDGYVDNADALAILYYDAGLAELTCPESVADVNNDDYVDNADALMVLKYDAGLIDSF